MIQHDNLYPYPLKEFSLVRFGFPKYPQLPKWSGAGETKHPIDIPDCYKENFELVYHEEFTLKVPFTRENWNGRMKACRGIGASLTEKEISMWEQEHKTLLRQIAPDEFDILHYAAIAELKKH